MLALRKGILSYVKQLTRIIATSAKLTHGDLVVHRDSPDNNEDTPFEFTQDNLTRIAALIKHNYPEGFERCVLGAALDLAQRQVGWVPISAMHRVAELLNIPRMRVYEWATFYTMIKRRYRGKFHVMVCQTTPCMLRGADEIVAAAEQACGCCVGGLSSDGLFGVDVVECAGACVNAPVVTINDDYYEDVTPDSIQVIIERLRNGDIPPMGPQNGRTCAEPLTGLTTLMECPPAPGFCVQPVLYKKK